MKRKVWIILLLVVLPFLVFWVFSSLNKRNALLFQLRSLQRENQQVAEENENLERIIQGIQSNVIKDLEVRQRLNYAAPGETLVVFVSPTPQVAATSTQNTFWDRVKNFFRK